MGTKKTTKKKTTKKSTPKKKNDSKLSFSSWVVIFTIIHIDLFVIASFILSKSGGMLNDTLITCFFTFYGVELISLAGIRIGKAKFSQTYEENFEESTEEV